MLQVVIAALVFILGSDLSAREIALTFDDAPRGDSQIFNGKERTQKLITNLRRSGVSQAAFFCNTAHMMQRKERLLSYASAGHIIANHTHSHPDLHETDLTSYLANIMQAHRLLKDFENFRQWFRYPFLREGDTREKRDGVRNALAEMNYRNGYVTVDTYDWYMDWLVQDAINSGKKVYFDKLKKVYIKVLSESIDFYDDLAKRVLGRSPKHVLLLHENDLAALFIEDLVEHLKKEGWTMISAEEAYTDPIADIEPDTFFLGQGRVVALAHMADDPGPFGKWESEAALQQLFNESGVFE